MRFSFPLSLPCTRTTVAVIAALAVLGLPGGAGAAERCVLGELFSGDG